MATILKNLSEYDSSILPSRERLANQKYAIAVAQWNPEVTHPLLRGAVDTLIEHGVIEDNIDIKYVPGTFELTHASRILQDEDKYAAIIAIGCVIRGDTPHFDYICQGVTYGIAKLNATSEIPVVYGLLTTNDQQQALDRCGGKYGNKGDECAIVAIKMAKF